MAQMNLSTKQAHRHREQTCGGGQDGLGAWDQQMQTIIYTMDRQQVLLYSTGNYIQCHVLNQNGKNMKNNTYMYNE